MWLQSCPKLPQCVKGIAAYGYCAAKQQTYYGFHGPLLLSATGVITMETALRSNMHDSRDPAWVALLKRLRRLLETVVGQLVERFSMAKVWAPDLWHLTSRIKRKLLAHTVCRWLNRHSPNPLQFEQLLAT
jgi:hypothetical protein